MAIVVVPLLSLLLPVAAVVVGGEATCPTPARVNEKLAQMGIGTAAPLSETSRQAVLSRNAQGLLVTLRSQEHTVLAERQFSAQASCEDLAAAAAVVIASWEAELGSEGSLGLQVRPSIPPPLPTVSHVWTWDVGLAAQVGFAASSVAPGAWLEASLGRTSRPWRMVLSGFRQDPLALSLGKGEALWSRTGVSVGPRFEVQRRRLMWAVDLLAYAAYLKMQGRAQPQNFTDATFDAGATAQLRLGPRFGNLVPWVSVGASYSPFERQLVIEPTTSKNLPVLQLFATVGFSWRFGDFSAH